MQDLIARLRTIDVHWEPGQAQELCRAAADAIEKLSADRQAGGDAGERNETPAVSTRRPVNREAMTTNRRIS